MGMPETLPRHKTTERTRKGMRTKQKHKLMDRRSNRHFHDSSKTQARTRVRRTKRKDGRILWDGEEDVVE